MKAGEVRGTYPLTAAHVGPDALREFERVGGDFLAFIQMRYARPIIVDRAVRDLAFYEHERARLAHAPALAKNAAPLAQNPTLAISPSARLLMYGADLPGMIDALTAGQPADPKPRRAWLLLIARGGNVDVRRLDDEEGWLLEWFRDPTPLAKAIDIMEERAPFEELWARGLLVEAKA